MSLWPPLQALLDDHRVSEVMINGPGAVWVEREGTLVLTDVRVDDRTLDGLVERLLAPTGRRVDRRNPFADARLADGSRLNVVIPPAAVDGPCVTIRRFASAPRNIDAFTGAGPIRLLRWAIEARLNILVTGGAGAGKTTLLNALARAVSPAERVVTIEDAAELRLQAEHVVRLEAHPANSEGAGGVSVRELLRNALRMRPDRLVVGEVRGAEVVEMLHAMSTGHDGSLSTCHANGPLDALRRIETMVSLTDPALAGVGVREQLASAIDLVVHLVRGADGTRRIAQIAEVEATPPLAVRVLARSCIERLPERPGRRSTVHSPAPSWIGS
jgi:pilus assembly protein CpaF